MTRQALPGEDDATRTSLDQDALLRTGELVAGRYRIEALAGVGGIGIVYRARDERLGVPVALKVLRAERSGDPRVIRRLEQEIVLARQVTHRNVVRIHDLGEAGELSFLTMDFVEGRSLKQILEDEGPLDAARASAIARDLAEALAAAHQEGVVHRDLKPANVLIAADGRAMVTDFGVARSLAGAGLTRAGSIIGTPHYLAPEQARGQEVDGRADIYALGLMMFEMLTGVLPFRGETLEELLAQRVTGGLCRLEALPPGTPGWLREIIVRCLAADPAQRYPDAAELATDLAAGRARSWSARPSRAVLAGGLAALVLLVSAAVALHFAGREDAPPAAGPARMVALLPATNLTGHAELDWLSTGLADILAQELAESRRLQVVDSLRVFRTVEHLGLDLRSLGPTDLQRLGELLDVDHLVLGTVRLAEERIRAELRVSDVRLPVERAPTITGEVVGLDQLFALAEDLGGRLRQALAVDPVVTGAPAVSADPAAMAAYAAGLEYLLQGDSLAAAPMLEQAVELDADFPASWVRLAMAYEQLGYRDRALAAAREAVERLGEHPGRVALEARAREAVLSGDFDRARQALGLLVEHYPHDLEAQVALAEALGEHGLMDEARTRLAKVVAASPNHPRAWFLLGKYAILAGDSRAAVDDYLVRALVIQNRLGSRQARADVQNALGIAYAQLGEYPLAKERYREAIVLRRDIGDERGTASATANLARLSLRDGEFDEARAGLQAALDTFERIGDRRAAASLYNEIGFLEEQRGAYRDALENYRRALALLRDSGDQRSLAETYNNVAFGYYLLGKLDDAAVFGTQAMQLYDAAGNRHGMMIVGQTLGLLELGRGNWDAAARSLLQVVELGRELGDTHAEAMALGNLGRIAQFQGRFGAADRAYRDALAVLQPLEDARGLLEFTLCLADLAFSLGLHAEGAAALDEAASWLDAASNLEQQAEWLRLRGRSLLLAGELPAARHQLAEAVEKAARSGSVLARLNAGLAQAEAQLAIGEAHAVIAELEALQREAREVGFLVPALAAGELLARAAIAGGDLDMAAQWLRTGLQHARTHRPYAHTFRLHVLLAEVMRHKGDLPGALEQERAAAAELERVLGELDPDQRAAFEGLEHVRRILAHAALDTAA
jgi:eukaryotic-like serine/threonine-protein kinase